MYGSSRASDGTVSVICTLVWSAGTQPPLIAKPCGGVFQRQLDVLIESVAAQSVDGDRDRRTGAGTDRRRDDAQLEIGAAALTRRRYAYSGPPFFCVSPTWMKNDPSVGNVTCNCESA